MTVRTARIARAAFRPTVEEVQAYLPSNYHVLHSQTSESAIYIAGQDSAGWTLDDYVIPRLASGLICAREVEQPSPEDRARAIGNQLEA